MDLRRRIKHAWNAFMGRDPTVEDYGDYGVSYATSPITASQVSGYGDRSFVNSIFNMIARDVSSIDFNHIKTDEEGRFLEVMDSSLQECLTVEANLDQTGHALIQDAVTRMLRQGVVAIYPYDCNADPDETGTYDIFAMSCADIIQWYPQHVKIRIYNPYTGLFVEKVVKKENTAIIQNPMYSIMNEPNSILQKIYKKLALLDVIDNSNASTKLNMIIQLPYNTKTQTRQDYAQRRIAEVEEQLVNSPRGIAYMDINEKITQLSKPLENNILEHIKYLIDMYKQQLGISDELLNGTANEEVYNNYITRIVEPICVAFCDEMKRKWLTKTARTKGQSITFFKDQFRYIPTSQLAKLADVLSRNQIMTPNELRQKMGLKPSDDPKADELNNANMPDYPEAEAPVDESIDQEQMTPEEFQAQNQNDEFEDQKQLTPEEFRKLSSSELALFK